MLKELIAEGLGVIERAELQLGAGSSALTGETGAGKTLVVAALGLLLGGRADRALVRDGRDRARVEGVFVVPGDHPAAVRLREEGILEVDIPEDGAGGEVELIVTRTVAADGAASRARVNGHNVTIATLEAIGGALVEIAGQHEHQRLTSQHVHRTYLDSFAGADELAAAVGVEVRAAASAARRLEELVAKERARERELDVLRYEIDEIAGASLEVGETARLVADARRLEHAESIGAAVSDAVGALRGEGGAEETTDRAARALAEAAALDPELEPAARRLADAAIELADIGRELGGRDLSLDPDALSETRGRLDAIARLTRKYGDDEAEVLAYLARSEARIGELESEAADAASLEAEVREHLERAEDLAGELSERRAAAAPRLSAAVEGLLGELALTGARFSVDLQPAELYEGGRETVGFLVSLNGGDALRPLTKVASGGELSRTALALHLVASGGTAGTMIFDEVDAGVGGVAARAVGRCLSKLARRSGAQVLVVTHLPQVAAFADAHYRVTKTGSGSRTSAVVVQVDGDERIEELSRMLAGLPESDRAREHAQELLDMAAAG